MKVVCIKVPKTNVKISLTKNEILEAFKESYENKMSYHMGIPRESWFIFDKFDNKIFCDAFDRREYFITLEEFRNRKISELI